MNGRKSRMINKAVDAEYPGEVEYLKHVNTGQAVSEKRHVKRQLKKKLK